MLTIELMKGGYYVLRYVTEYTELIKVFRGTEGVDPDTLEREPGGFYLRINDKSVK